MFDLQGCGTAATIAQTGVTALRPQYVTAELL
jgi:hypothetical protein